MEKPAREMSRGLLSWPWLGFVTISAVLHLVLLQWVGMPQAPTPAGDSVPVLRVRIAAGSGKHEAAPGAEAPPVVTEDDGVRGTSGARTDVAGSGQGSAAAKGKPAVRTTIGADKTDHPAHEGFTPDADTPEGPPVPVSPAGRPAAELVRRALDSIPEVLEELDREAFLARPGAVFDPDLRDRLAASREAERRRRQVIEQLDDHGQEVEITGLYGDYFGVRIGDKCWRVPVGQDSGVSDIRVWMLESACPSRRRIEFQP